MMSVPAIPWLRLVLVPRLLRPGPHLTPGPGPPSQAYSYSESVTESRRRHPDSGGPGEPPATASGGHGDRAGRPDPDYRAGSLPGP
jgi:hypothetical protein